MYIPTSLLLVSTTVDTNSVGETYAMHQAAIAMYKMVDVRIKDRAFSLQSDLFAAEKTMIQLLTADLSLFGGFRSDHSIKPRKLSDSTQHSVEQYQKVRNDISQFVRRFATFYEWRYDYRLEQAHDMNDAILLTQILIELEDWDQFFS